MVKIRKIKSVAALEILKEVNMEEHYENIVKLSTMNFSIFLNGLQIDQDKARRIKEARRIARNTTYAARKYQDRQKNRVKDLDNKIRKAKLKQKDSCEKIENLLTEKDDLEKELKTLAILAGLYDGEIRCHTCGVNYRPSCLTTHYITIGE